MLNLNRRVINVIGITVLLLLICNLSYGQSKKAIKQVQQLVKAEEMVYFPGGVFTSGQYLSRENKYTVHKGDHFYVQEIPSRESCESFLLCNHEVTVEEYLEFVFGVSEQTIFTEIQTDVSYTFSHDGKDITVPILPVIKDMNHIDDSYLTDPEYHNHPIIGVSWLQANAYIYWLNSKLNNQKTEVLSESVQYILPSHLQWEYTARFRPITMTSQEVISSRQYYPWKDNELTSAKGSYKANFGLIVAKEGVVVKEAADDNHTYSAPVKSYHPHQSMYDLAGNVSEWTASTESDTLSGHIAKGGSYNSDPVFMQNGVMQLLPTDYRSNEIGFRVGMLVDEGLLKVK